MQASIFVLVGVCPESARLTSSATPWCTIFACTAVAASSFLGISGHTLVEFDVTHFVVDGFDVNGGVGIGQGRDVDLQIVGDDFADSRKVDVGAFESVGLRPCRCGTDKP